MNINLDKDEEGSGSENEDFSTFDSSSVSAVDSKQYLQKAGYATAADFLYKIKFLC